jgi:hypothetical protein
LAIDAFRSAHETLLELGCLNIEESIANADISPIK